MPSPPLLVDGEASDGDDDDEDDDNGDEEEVVVVVVVVSEAAAQQVQLQSTSSSGDTGVHSCWATRAYVVSTTSAAAREQFALLQVRKRNELADAKRRLSQYAYDPRTKQLVSKTKSTPTYYRSAIGLMSWPQYKRFRENPSLQQGFRAENLNNSARSR